MSHIIFNLNLRLIDPEEHQVIHSNGPSDFVFYSRFLSSLFLINLIKKVLIVRCVIYKEKFK